MTQFDWPIDEAGKVRLHQYWTIDGLTAAEIARRFGTTSTAVVGKVARLRRREGEERWPHRDSPVRPAVPAPRHPRRLRAGASTLPPLSSLKQ